MKKSFITSLLLLLCLAGFSQVASAPQNWDYEIRGKHNNSIKRDKLANAKTMSDIMANYPVLWITSYKSVELSVTCNGKTIKTYSENEVLTEEQKSLLSMADISTDIVININYNCKNAVTDKIESSKMHYVTTVVPEVEAEYISGAEALKQYLKENAIDIISAKKSNETIRALVKFVVSEDGKITNIELTKTSGNQDYDKLLVETLTKMPKWKPAANAKGEKVKQSFEFSLNSPNVGGC